MPLAIYHCSVRTFSRSKGHSAVAAAAYRSGCQLYEERTGKTHRYDRRAGVKQSFILLPENAPEDMFERAVLWNAAEGKETRKNSRVAREVVLALPHELSEAGRASLAKDMASWLLERYRVAVDTAIHEPVHGDDIRNHHAHLLFSTRELTKSGFGAKTRILDDKTSGPEEIEIIREVWEALANDALARAGFEDIQIDRRTLADQGIDRIPQTHIGPNGKKAADRADDEDDKGETGKKGSGGGSSIAPNKTKSEDTDETEDGKSGSGDPVSLKLESKLRKDHKGRDIDYRVIDRLKTRQNFVEEIKALNEKRAAFGNKPLKEQIKDLDKLMERLDKRVQRLEELESKTSLPAQLLEMVKEAAKMAVSFFSERQNEKLLSKFSASEEQAQKDRQKARYGRTYRKGLHAQIIEIKANIERLETKQAEYSRYSAFVEKLEKEIAHHTPSITKEKIKDPTKPAPKTTNTESTLKLQLKASIMRDNLPLVFQQAQVKKPAQVDSPQIAKIFSQSSETPPQPELRTGFKTQVESTPDTKPYKESMPVRIKALEQAVKAKEPDKYETARKEPWFSPKTEKTAFLQAEIKVERARLKPIPEPSRSIRQVTNQDIQEKTKAEAQPKRDRIPPQFKPQEQEKPRAIFKGLEREISKRQATQEGRSLKAKFDSGSGTPEEKQELPKVKTADVLDRLKQKAAEQRAKTYPKYRAKAYSEGEKPPESSSAKPDSKAAFKHKSSRSKPKTKMSEGFNRRSGVNTQDQPSSEFEVNDWGVDLE